MIGFQDADANDMNAIWHYIEVERLNVETREIIDGDHAFSTTFGPYRFLAARVVAEFLYDFESDDQKTLQKAWRELQTKDFEFWCGVAELDPDAIRRRYRGIVSRITLNQIQEA